MYKAIIRAVAQELSKREREGFMIQQIGTHRKERKTVTYQELYIKRDGVI